MSGLKTTPDERAEWRRGAEFRDFADDTMLLTLLDDLDEALAAIECVVDHGALANYDSSEDGIEGIPGYEFRDKWGTLSEAQILNRLRDVLPPRE